MILDLVPERRPQQAPNKDKRAKILYLASPTARPTAKMVLSAYFPHIRMAFVAIVLISGLGYVALLLSPESRATTLDTEVGADIREKEIGVTTQDTEGVTTTEVTQTITTDAETGATTQVEASMATPEKRNRVMVKIPQSDQYKQNDAVVPDLLTQQTIEKIKKFSFFLGHPHSGHSIVGTIIDSHPHIVMAHEADIFSRVQKWKECNKTTIFNTIWKTVRTGTILQEQTLKGYNLTIDKSYQNTFQDYIDVIGDKKGGWTAQVLLGNPGQWETVYNRIRTAVNLPMKVFHVIRNPYDNVASKVLCDYSGDLKLCGKLRVSNKTYAVNSRAIDNYIRNYFEVFQAIENAKQEYKLDVLEVHGSDLVANPKKSIGGMFDFLGVSVSDELLNICSKKVFPKESKLRYKIKWQDEQISTVKEYMQNFANLKRYTDFDS